MKRYLYIFISIVAVIITLTSCEDNLHIVFTDYYVCIKDENGADKSTVKSNLDEEVYTYYVSLVAPTQDNDIVVDYEIIPGDGLKEGVDYKMQRDSRSVTMAKGVYKMPIRVVWLAHKIDPDKDNSLTIKLTGCNNSSITIGYPGPSAKYSTHKITKIN
ncbi:MAG: hypothetical protein MJY83_01990 [Bacteroidales bacterium]|nr:hypothetical protein [Bacteroidales bacterium]